MILNRTTVNKYLGLVGMVLSVSLTVVGLPMQIWTNYKNNSTDGLSVWLMIFMTTIYFVWASYAWTKKPVDYYLGIPQTLGFFVSLLLWIQWFYYYLKL